MTQPRKTPISTKRNKIYLSLADVQPKLAELYTGDYSQFGELICPNCKRIAAIEPKDCGECGELICKSCQTNPNVQKCLACNADFKSLRNTSKAVLNIFKNAVFACPMSCGQNRLQLSQMERHLKELCGGRLVKCPLGCGQKI